MSKRKVKPPRRRKWDERIEVTQETTEPNFDPELLVTDLRRLYSGNAHELDETDWRKLRYQIKKAKGARPEVF